MFDFTLMEYKLDEALHLDFSERQRDLAAYLADQHGEKHPGSIRRRIAAAILGFALRLDPDALAVAPRSMALEGFNVRD